MEVRTTRLTTPQQIVKTLRRSGHWTLAWPNQTWKSRSLCLSASVSSVLSLPSATYVSRLICNRLTIKLAFIMRLTKLHRGRTLHKNNSGKQDRASPPQLYQKEIKFWILKVTDFGETTLQENSLSKVSLKNASHTLNSGLTSCVRLGHLSPYALQGGLQTKARNIISIGSVCLV